MNLEQIQNKIEMLEVSFEGLLERLNQIEKRNFRLAISKPAFRSAFKKAVSKVEERRNQNGVSKV